MAISSKDSRKFKWAAVAVAFALSAVAITGGSASPSAVDIPADSASLREDFGNIDASTDAAQRFADAAFGVDPVVTGPVSTAFKQQRQAANCDSAVWPNVPAACYPD